MNYCTKPKIKRYPASLLFVLLFVGITGCATQKVVLNNIKSTRQQAVSAIFEQTQTNELNQVWLNGKLGLQDAVRLALQYNKELSVLMQEREIAKGRMIEAHGTVLPNIDARAGYTRLDEVTSFDIGGRELSIGFEDNYSVELTVRQPVYHGGALSAAIRLARIYALLTDENIRSAVQGTIFQVCQSYFDAILAKHLLKVNEDAVTSALKHLEMVRIQRQQGLASDYEVLRAEVEVSSFRAELVKHRNALNLAQTRLLRNMGVSQESQIDLSDELIYSPIKPVLEEAVRIAKQNRADIYQAELGVRIQKEALRIARSSYLPWIDTFLTQKWANPDPHKSTQDEWGNAWTAGISLSLPIFDGFKRNGKVRQEQARLQQVLLNLTNTEEKVEFELKQALLNLQDAEEFVQSQQKNIQQAQEGLKLVEVGYKQGVRTELEVIDALLALTRTQTLYYQALYSHILARLNLQRAMGILGPGHGDIKLSDSLLKQLFENKNLEEENKGDKK